MAKTISRIKHEIMIWYSIELDFRWILRLCIFNDKNSWAEGVGSFCEWCKGGDETPRANYSVQLNMHLTFDANRCRA